MQIRPVAEADLNMLEEIDGTIESNRYLHVESSGTGMNMAWRMEERPLRSRLIEPNRLGDEPLFAIQQIATGADEGLTLLAEHEDAPVALLAAQPRPGRGIMQLIDLRVDCDHRREGLASAMLFHVMQVSREAGLRAVAAQTRTNNFPASQLLAKLGFELTGLDVQRHSTHDLVKESVTLFWYAALD